MSDIDDFGPDRTVTHRIGSTGPIDKSGLSRAEILKLAQAAFDERLAPYAYFAALMGHTARKLRYQADEFEPEHAVVGRAMANLIETAMRECGLQPDGRVAPDRKAEAFDPIDAATRIVTNIRK